MTNFERINCYTQAIWRKVLRLGLAGLYSANPAIYIQIRKLMALAFAPLLLVRNTFNIFQAAADPQLAPLFAYFDDQWMTRTPLGLWNVYRVSRRTNNHLEGWHNRFANIVRKNKPNIWILICALKNEQAATEVQRAQIAAGQIVQRQEKRYKQVEKNIKALTRRYRHGQMANGVEEYLQGISHNLARF
jgi:hypothetical protein